MELARAAGDPEALAWIAQGSTREQPQFRASGGQKDSREMGHGALLERLAALGHRALAVELSLPGDPLASVRVMVPGLCAMRGRTDVQRFARLCPGVEGPALPEPY